MAWPDGEQLGAKINASCVHYAGYMASNPSATPDQLKLAKVWKDGPSITSQYLTTLAHLQGYDDSTAYATIDAWVNAREGEVISLFLTA